MESSSSSTSVAYQDMNGKLLLSLVELFHTPEFNPNFDALRFKRNAATRWIRKSNLVPAKLMLSKIIDKATERTIILADATINDPTDAVLTEISSRQVSQIFRAALGLYTFAGRDQHVRQEFIFMF